MTGDFNAAAARIRAIPAAVGAGLERALAETAEACAESARAAVPVDSGELKASIAASASGFSAQVTAAAKHAAMLEYGTSRMPPQPYMQVAAASARTILYERAAEAVRSGVGGKGR